MAIQNWQEKLKDALLLSDEDAQSVLKGYFKTSGGPNGCAFILLLCIGILPGLIYMFAVPTHRSCPRCGQEAK